MLKDSEYAKAAYEKTREGERSLPPWIALYETERELLIRMFILGAEHACAELLRPKTATSGRASG